MQSGQRGLSIDEHEPRVVYASAIATSRRELGDPSNNVCGKVKHMDVKSLWIQERESVGDLTVVKVPRLENCSDLLTHHYTEAEAELHLSRMSVERRCSASQTSSEGG